MNWEVEHEQLNNGDIFEVSPGFILEDEIESVRQYSLASHPVTRRCWG
jgi:hypothetical protein